jgi:2,3-bisphosphoglycerate-independent phosphoglycerate mutase
VAIHAFTDGRDTLPRAAPDYVKRFEADLAGLPDVRIATIIGRYFAMDRDKRWDRVAQAYEAMVTAKGASAASATAAISAAHAADKTDEFIPASVIGDYAGMRDGDGRGRHAVCNLLSGKGVSLLLQGVRGRL